MKYKLFFLVLIFFAAAIFYLNRDYIYSQLVVQDILEWKEPSKKTSPVFGERVVRQYFTPHFNGLFRIGFPVEYRKPSRAKIEVSLRENDTDIELFKEIIPLEEFPEDKMRRFSFSPQWDSAGKSYCLNIRAREAEPETKVRLLFDPGPFFHIKTGGKLYFGEKELPGELSMVSECRVRISKDGFLSSWHKFLRDRGFAVFYIGIMAVGMGLTCLARRSR